MDSPHKGPVTWKMFPFDDIIMYTVCSLYMLSKLDSVIVNHVFYDSVKTHRGLVTSYAVIWVNIAFSNCLSTNRLVVVWALKTNFGDILSKVQHLVHNKAFGNIRYKWWSFCSGSMLTI